MSVLQNNWVRAAIVAAAAAGLAAALVLHGPNWGQVGSAFTQVRWQWVAAAIGLNLASVLVRAVAWRTVITQAMPPPHPSFMLVFSAFSVGLFANAVLPGRIGELARVAVLTRKLPDRRGAWATLVGTVFAHRVFDLVASILLVLYVALTARIPDWAVTSLIGLVGLGVGALTLAILSARRHEPFWRLDSLGAIRKVIRLARYGLGVMRSPVDSLVAAFCQILGWTCQLLAVYTAMRAFDIHSPLPAAALVLVLMNVATIFPLWPGNVVLLQAAVAQPLLRYGVAYARGFAFGFGLQAIEASVGVGVGLIFLAREGLTFAMLKVMPGAEQAEVPENEVAEADVERPRARVPG